MKFSIRDLLPVTVIAALAVAWWVDRRQIIQREQEAAKDARWLLTLTNGDDPSGEEAAVLKALHEKYEVMSAHPLSTPAPNPPKP